MSPSCFHLENFVSCYTYQCHIPAWGICSTDLRGMLDSGLVLPTGGLAAVGWVADQTVGSQQKKQGHHSEQGSKDYPGVAQWVDCTSQRQHSLLTNTKNHHCY